MRWSRPGCDSWYATTSQKATIFQPGPPPERVYFLLEGTVRIYKEYSLAKEFTSEILTAGGAFGLEAIEGALRVNSTASGSGASSVGARSPNGAQPQGAQTLTNSKIASMATHNLAAAARREPGLAGILLEELMESARRRKEAAERLARRQVTPRLAPSSR